MMRVSCPLYTNYMIRLEARRAWRDVESASLCVFHIIRTYIPGTWYTRIIVCPERQQRENIQVLLQLLLRSFCQQGKNGFHTSGIEFSTHNSFDSRKYKLLCCPSATGKAIQRWLTGRAAHKQAKSSRSQGKTFSKSGLGA